VFIKSSYWTLCWAIWANPLCTFKPSSFCNELDWTHKGTWVDFTCYVSRNFTWFYRLIRIRNSVEVRTGQGWEVLWGNSANRSVMNCETDRRVASCVNRIGLIFTVTQCWSRKLERKPQNEYQTLLRCTLIPLPLPNLNNLRQWKRNTFAHADPCSLQTVCMRLCKSPLLVRKIYGTLRYIYIYIYIYIYRAFHNVLHDYKHL
jgi:hypothetical protein